jgi:uncharacterized protein YndB with AHSA1/START domain
MTQAGDDARAVRAEAALRDDLVFECELEATPAKVWRALAIPDYLAAWLAPGLPKPQSENGVAFDGRQAGLAGAVDCRLLAAEPPRRLRYSWHEEHGGGRLDSIVTFELEPARGGGTHLRITHGDFVVRPAAANLNAPTMMLRAA